MFEITGGDACPQYLFENPLRPVPDNASISPPRILTLGLLGPLAAHLDYHVHVSFFALTTHHNVRMSIAQPSPRKEHE